MSGETDARIEQARDLPIEAGLLGHDVVWKHGGVERCGPCPVCGGNDRFSINTAKGVWNCRGCAKGGDVIDLAQHVAGVGFLDAVALLVGEHVELRHEHHAPRKPVIDEEAKRKADEGAERDLASAARIVTGLQPIAATPLGKRYFAEPRHIDVAAIRDVLERTDAIGWHPSVYFNEPGHALHGQRLGCIVGIMTDPVTAKPTGAISRTYIDADLHKIGKAKTLARPKGVIRLSRDEDVLGGLHIAEGIETALSAMVLRDMRPMWAVGDANMMAAFPVLGGIECLTIIADHDRNGKGQAAAREAEKRWCVAGREVRIFMTRQLGDLNDLLRRKKAKK